MGEPKPLTAYQQTYHWRNKNCGPWAQEWIKKSLPGIKVTDGKQSAAIAEVTSVSGDCDLGQRKGKLLTIYDLEVLASWTGTNSEGEEVKGTVKCPEVSHEAIDGLSDYVYETSLTSPPSAPNETVLKLVKSSLLPKLSEKFNELRPALLEVHAPTQAELAAASTATSGTSTPNPASGSSYSPAPPTKSEEPKSQAPKPAAKEKSLSNTKTVELKAELQASAQDLWGLFTDQQKIPMWSRSEAKFTPTPDTEFSLFAGSVTGKVISAEPPNKLVTTWQPKKPNWPSDHYGIMTTTLKQGSDSTEAVFKLDGVPSGQEGEVEKAIDGFYIRGLKQMGLVLSSTSRTYTTPRSATTSTPSSRKKTRKSSTSKSWLPSSQTIGYTVVVGLCVGLAGIVISSFSR